MESEYALETIDVPIDVLEKVFAEYICKLREDGIKTTTLYKFCPANIHNKESNNGNDKYITDENQPPLHPPYMYLSYSRYMLSVPGNLFRDIPPLGGIIPLQRLPNVFLAHAREKTSSFSKDMFPNRKALNRGIPAPEHLPMTSISYGKHNNPTPRVKKSLIQVQLSSKTINILSYWNSKSGLTRHNLPKDGMGTKTCRNANTMIGKLLDGTLFSKTKFAEHNRKFSIEEILSAIDKFDMVCTSPEFMPRDKNSVRKLGFPQFLYEYVLRTSWFLRCVNDDLQRSVEVIMRPHVKPWYDALKETYLSSRSSRYSHLSERDTENLLDAAKILYNFQRKVIDDLTDAEETIRPLTPLVWCGWLFEALDYKTSPSRLADPRSCNYFLYSFLIKRGRLPGTQVGEPESVSTFSIYEQAL